MKAIVLDRYAKKSALRLADLPRPSLREDEVLVEVHAAGVNLLDSKIRYGEFKLILPYRLPIVLGHDVAGVVVEVGPQVRQFKPGDEVHARPDDFRIGTFAEFVPVKEASLALKPAGLTMVQAASIPLVGLTAWQALVEKARLKKGEKVFIQAGSGGVGTFAIQLAKHLGATVATTTSAANDAAHEQGLCADPRGERRGWPAQRAVGRLVGERRRAGRLLGQQGRRLVAHQCASPRTGSAEDAGGGIAHGLRRHRPDARLRRAETSAQAIVQRALDGLESGLDEVLADDLTQQVKLGITAPRPSYLPQQA
jgi:hypothetical protein